MKSAANHWPDVRGRLLDYLLEHKDALTESIRQRTYRPNPIRRVEIPRDSGKKRLLGIPTVVDRMVQQAIAQVLTPIYERQFSDGSYGFRPKRGAKQALVRVTETVNEGYRYKVKDIYQWLRRRLRMCIWKSWKKPRTRVKNLIRCGIGRWRAYQWGNTSKGYWRIADSWILTRAIGDESLHKAGYSWIGCYYSASALPKG